MMTIKILPHETGSPWGKLADVELHFDARVKTNSQFLKWAARDLPPVCAARVLEIAEEIERDADILDGLKLIGFGILERRAKGTRTVTFPARVNGERRSLALLRPIVEATATAALTARILEAYAEYETKAAVTA